MSCRAIIVVTLFASLAAVCSACAPTPTLTPPSVGATQAPIPSDSPRAVVVATQTVSRPTPTPFPTARPPIRIAWLPQVGKTEDSYYNSAVSDGVEAYMKEPGVVGDYLLARDPADYEKNLAAFVQKGYPLIFTISSPHAALTVQVALANPNLKFGILDYAYPDCLPGGKVGVDCWSDRTIPNVRGHIFQVDEGAFLAGYLAAGMSKTGKVGTLGGLQIPTVTIYMKGFQAGVEYYNTQKKTSVQVLGWNTQTDKGLFAGTMTDPAKVQSASKSLIDDGADVIMPVAGLATGGGLSAAKAANNVFAIGVDTDHCYTTPTACDILLTSVEKEMGEAVIDTIKSVQDGTFQGGKNYIGTLKNEGVGLAPFNKLTTKIPDVLKKELEIVRQDLVGGKIKTGVDPL